VEHHRVVGNVAHFHGLAFGEQVGGGDQDAFVVPAQGPDPDAVQRCGYAGHARVRTAVAYGEEYLGRRQHLRGDGDPGVGFIQ
jgi:hypothetical protein